MRGEKKPSLDKGKMERWTDSAKVIWGLFAIIVALLGYWSQQLSDTTEKLQHRVMLIETDRGSLKADMEYLKVSIQELKLDVKALSKENK